MPGLEDLYREIILDHYRSPRNRGELPVPPATRAEGFNPLCGDEIVLDVLLEGDTVADIRIGGQGCSISQSSASMMSAAVKGRSVSDVARLTRTFKAMMQIHSESLGGGDGSDDADDADEATVVGPEELKELGDLAALQGVVKFPVRIKCATLAWFTLDDALTQAATADS